MFFLYPNIRFAEKVGGYIDTLLSKCYKWAVICYELRVVLFVMSLYARYGINTLVRGEIEEVVRI